MARNFNENDDSNADDYREEYHDDRSRKNYFMLPRKKLEMKFIALIVGGLLLTFILLLFVNA